MLLQTYVLYVLFCARLLIHMLPASNNGTPLRPLVHHVPSLVSFEVQKVIVESRKEKNFFRLR